jgi:hypothetical protein
MDRADIMMQRQSAVLVVSIRVRKVEDVGTWDSSRRPSTIDKYGPLDGRIYLFHFWIGGRRRVNDCADKTEGMGD